MTDPRYSSAAWKRLRKAVRQRDGNVCQIRLPGCKGIATQVDHVVEPGPPHLKRDAQFFDANNLQAACRSCNVAKRNARRNKLAREAEAQAVTPKGRFQFPPGIDPMSNEGVHYGASQNWAPCDCLGCQLRRRDFPDTDR